MAIISMSPTKRQLKNMFYTNGVAFVIHNKDYASDTFSVFFFSRKDYFRGLDQTALWALWQSVVLYSVEEKKFLAYHV
jgi:hypothetical protein